MRIILFFDLPMNSKAEIRAYNHFRKAIMKEGFIMMQESVYSKLAFNKSIVDSSMVKVKMMIPNKGLIQVLIVTEKQFNAMINVLGEPAYNEIDTDKELIIL